MSTDQTPALARAAEESFRAGAENAARLIGIAEPIQWSSLSREDQEHVAIQARAAVFAALHDPDDDVIARTLLAHRWDDGGYDGMGFLCICGHITGPGGDTDTSWAFSVHIADAVRAAILGSDQ